MGKIVYFGVTKRSIIMTNKGECVVAMKELNDSTRAEKKPEKTMIDLLKEVLDEINGRKK